MTWWDTSAWHAYEVACGDAPGTRASLLATGRWQTQMIDLTLTEAELWKDVRKSYKSLVHRHRSLVQTWTAGEAIATVQRIHDEQAGFRTRSDATWALMLEWLETDRALLLTTKRGAHTTAYAYFLVWQGWAYYASAASIERDMNHALIWAAMQALKFCEVRRMEMGWQGYATDSKGKSIEFFRRGFGGRPVSLQESGCAL